MSAKENINYNRTAAPELEKILWERDDQSESTFYATVHNDLYLAGTARLDELDELDLKVLAGVYAECYGDFGSPAYGRALKRFMEQVKGSR